MNKQIHVKLSENPKQNTGNGRILKNKDVPSKNNDPKATLKQRDKENKKEDY